MTESTKSAAQLLEESKLKLNRLAERRTRAQALLEAERQRLEEARADARAEFGTDDLEALRRLYTERSAENNIKVLEFMDGVEAAERQLADVERQLAA
jgi:hypothetical protein